MKKTKDSLKTKTSFLSPSRTIPLSVSTETQTQAEPKPEVGGKLRLALLFGGASSEREISLESARHVYNNLDREKYFVSPIFVDNHHRLWLIEEWQLWKNTSLDLTESLKDRGHRLFYEELKDHFDFVFIALHGKWGEEAFPGLLEILNIPNNSASVLGGALSMDKYRQRLILEAAGVAVPKFVPINRSEFNTSSEIENCKLKIENSLGYPFMVKPIREGSSTALSKVSSSEEIEKAFEKAFAFDNLILAEEVLSGMELTTLVYGVNDSIKALPPSQLLRGGDYLTAEEKFLPGGAQMITPAPIGDDLIKKVQEESIRTFEALSLKVYSRIDSFLVGDKVVILEPNNPPAMTPSTALWLQAAEAGFNASQFLDEIIKISLQAHTTKIGPL